MLELAVNIRHSETVGDYARKGDIIDVRSAPGGWSALEKTRWLITQLQDSTMEELELGSGRLITLPFVRKDAENALPVEKSTFRVDLAMFTGQAGVDPEVYVEDPSIPAGLNPYLTMADLIYDAPTAGADKMALLDCTGKKAELSLKVLESSFDFVERLVYTVNDKVWRHGFDPPSGVTVVELDDIAEWTTGGKSLMGYPLNARDLVDAGLAAAQSAGAKYVTYGRTFDLPNAVACALGRDLIPIRPLLGKTDAEISADCITHSISYVDETLTVEGQTFIHGRVV